MNQEKTVSEKIVRLLVWITALAFTLISLGTAVLVYQLSLDGSITSLRAASDALAADVNGWFQRAMADCAQTARIVDGLYDFHGGVSTVDERRHVYKALVAANKQYLDIYDSVGPQEFISGVGDTVPAGFDATRRVWYIEAMKNPGKTTIVSPYIDIITGQTCMTFAQTISPNDGSRGVMGVDITLDQIRDYIGKANTNPKSRFAIVDDNGRIIMHPDPALMPRQDGSFTTLPPHLWQEIINSGGSTLVFDLYGKPSYYISSPLHSMGWRIVSVVRLSEVIEPIIAVVALIVASFAVIISCIVIMLKSRLNTLVSAPLDSLREIVDDITAGSDHVLVEPDRYHAEFRLFAESFKQMCELRYTASHDGLSGLLNRSAFFSAAERDYALMRRQGSPGCALMMDIDFFKKVNDTHGHSVGDKVIVGVAAVLKERLRITDISGRYGGEEFCVWLPNTDRQGALVLAEELRHSVAALQFQGEVGPPFAVTISIGLADAEAANIGALLEYADQALYQAKRGGRNRVDVYVGKE
ncbi:MAG: diguanylate cyclase [Desulfobulbaceae bacterium]|jgi:diguanylate cyclase (GGDEF)-like protein|nr:diguanylate cyclase [Desulfobulbaceae bacterium]